MNGLHLIQPPGLMKMRLMHHQEHHRGHQAEGPPGEGVRCALQVDDWGAFDVFKVASLTRGRPLEAVALAVLHRFDLVEKLGLPEAKLRAFLRASALSPLSALLFDISMPNIVFLSPETVCTSRTW